MIRFFNNLKLKIHRMITISKFLMDLKMNAKRRTLRLKYQRLEVKFLKPFKHFKTAAKTLINVY